MEDEKEIVHFVGPGAKWCRDWNKGDEFAATKFMWLVTCKECQATNGIIQTEDLDDIVKDIEETFGVVKK